MYEFSRGPLVWIAFAVFFGGSLYRIISTIIQSKKDKVVLPYMKWKFSLRSIMHWIMPLGSVNMRMRPAFTIFSFLFHICLLATPLLTLGHVVLFKESWGFDWWTLPAGLSTVMTLFVICGGILFGLRRIADPTVRLVSSFSDFVLLAIVLGPFITGLLAYFQVFEYQTIIILHMWSGALWLCVVPFTRMVHMIMFPLTRGYMGCEFGYVRNARDW
ncbi:MAG: nitrate reductase [candidate division Zixibacteria bacterium]|nr:nitrate reductase [candidate division Zixibacteria bacterium]